MQRDKTDPSGSNHIVSTSRSLRQSHDPNMRPKLTRPKLTRPKLTRTNAVARLVLLTAAVLSVSASGCRSCVDVCHWHQRPAHVHAVRYHVAPPMCAPVALPVVPTSDAHGMVGGCGISEQVPMTQGRAAADWPGGPAVDVVPVPRDWGSAKATDGMPRQSGNSDAGMADVPEAIEVPETQLPPIQPARDPRAIEL